MRSKVRGDKRRAVNLVRRTHEIVPIYRDYFFRAGCKFELDNMLSIVYSIISQHNEEKKMNVVTMVIFTIIGSHDGNAVSHSVSQVSEAACSAMQQQSASLELPAASRIRYGEISITVLCLPNQ
jgi:hypothetical protein